MLTRFACPLMLAAHWLLVGFASSLSADNAIKEPDEPVTLANGLSPDGRKEVVFVWRTDPIEGWGTCYVRSPKTNELKTAFAWKGFGQPYEVLWRPDSRAFAIKGEAARGYVVCEVYLRESNGRYHLIKIPDLVKCVAAKYHLEVYGKGGEHPVKWLPGDCLAVDVYDRSWSIKDAGDAEQPYRVTIQLPVSRAPSHRAVIKDIRPISIP